MARPPILSVALPSDTGRVLSIQSHTVQGYVGNKSSVFPLQLLGFDVDPINSVQFSNHTGYPTFRGQVLDGKQLWDLIEGLEANQLLHYTHLLTVCDPVLGDEGKLYVPQELISVYQQKVIEMRRFFGCGPFQTEWELRGLDVSYAPSSFDLGVSGSLYADRSRSRSRGCRMRGHLEIAITCVLPPPLHLVPETILRGVAESVLSRLAEKMKRDVDVGLGADFRRFHREKAAASRAMPTLDATASSRDQSL